VDAFETLDEDLTVDDQFSDTHMLRLNKFNVVRPARFHKLQ